MVPEAPLEQTGLGLAPAGEGWFVLNAREARWRHREGRGDGPCVVLGVRARQHMGDNCNGGAYTVDEAALRHGAGVEVETSDPDEAYARFPEPEPARYRDGWLPG